MPILGQTGLQNFARLGDPIEQATKYANHFTAARAILAKAPEKINELREPRSKSVGPTSWTVYSPELLLRIACVNHR